MEQEEDLKVLQVRAGVQANGERWIVKAQIEGRDADPKVDTGSQANLLPSFLFNKLQTTAKIAPSSTVLNSYNDGVITHLGKAVLPAKLGGNRETLKLYVVKRSRQAILGLRRYNAFGLVKRVNFGLAKLSKEY